MRSPLGLACAARNVPNSLNAPPALLSVRSLECARGDELIFEDLSFEVSGGEILQVLGANGSGKTSLLRILSGLSTASAGHIVWQDRPVAEDAAEWQSQLQYLSHAMGITATLSVEENLRYAIAIANRPLQNTLDDALARVGLHHVRRVQAGRLSAGQRQRAALARLLLIPALVWLLDEPLTALDKAGKALLESMLTEHAMAGGLALVATHQALTIAPISMRTLQLSRTPAA